MAEEELQALWARLDERMLNLTRSVDNLTQHLEKLATKTELEQKAAAIHDRIDRVENKVNGNAPRSIWKAMTEVAIGVAAMAGAAGVIYKIVEWVAHK